MRWYVTILAVTALCAAAPVAHAQEEAVGVVRGSVYDKEFGVPLANARVSIVELGLSAMTTADGTFAFQRVPAGAYTLTFVKDGYDREIRTGVAVSAGRLTDVRVDLPIEVVELEELVVSGTGFFDNSEVGLLELRSVAVAVQDAVSADLIRQAGASDVAGALKLVVGASVVEGKYATVRGLSDRYTGVTLNGVRVPSADPRRRAVQIDIFPTGTIDSITVTKTFTPDLQGDFTGGGVDIKTKAIPEDKLLAVSVSTEYNSAATGNEDFLTYSGGGVDWTGFQDGSRDVPAAALEPFPPVPGYIVRLGLFPSDQEIANAQWISDVTRSFAPVMGSHTGAPGPGRGFALTGGRRFNWHEHKLGLLGSFSYSHKFDFYEGAKNYNAEVSGPENPIAQSKARTDSKGTDEVLMGLLLGAGFEVNENHHFTVQLIGNHSATDEARLQILDLSPDNRERNQALEYAERSVASLQIHGENRFKNVFGTAGKRGFSDISLNWTLSGNYTRQDEPDVRFFRDSIDPTTLLVGAPRAGGASVADAPRRIFRNIEEANKQLMLHVTAPFTNWTGVEGHLRAGLYFERADRDYFQRSFFYEFPRQGGRVRNNPDRDYNESLTTYYAPSIDGLWTDVFADPSRTGLAGNRCEIEATTCTVPIHQLLWYLSPLGDDVDYIGVQDIDAAYVMAELPLLRWLRFVGGVRQERTTLSVTPTSQSGYVDIIEKDADDNRAIVTVPQETARTSIDDKRNLPSLGLVADLHAQMKLRLSWSRTIARPTFRELAPVATEEFLAGDEFLGEPRLKLSGITNYDARWEWFPRPGEVLAASLFYKELTDPIEYVSFGASNRSFVQPTNYDEGTARGFEIEARTGLDVLWKSLKGLAAGVNLSVIDSEVTVPEHERTGLELNYGLGQASRRLLGQPEYVLNLNVTYDNDDLGFSAGLFYNVTGETLITGAASGNTGGIPDAHALTYATLDLTASKKFGKGLALGLKAQNLFAGSKGSEWRTPANEVAIRTDRPTARTFGLSLGYKW